MMPMGFGLMMLATAGFLGPRPTQTAMLSSATTSAGAQGEIAPAATATAAASATTLHLSFDVGEHSYLKLADIEHSANYFSVGVDDEAGDELAGEVQRAAMKLPAHGALQLVRVDAIPSAAVAPVAAEDLPRVLGSWLHRQVRVDESCDARVTGFAVVAQAYAPDLAYEQDSGRLSDDEVARLLFDELGHRVLAATLDGCSGGYAYALPADGGTLETAPVAARPLEDAALAQQARTALSDSAPGRDAQRRWQEAGFEGAWMDQAELAVQVFEHPLSGARWASVHALADVECGGLELNLLGMYEWTRDGAIIVHLERALDDIATPEYFVDSDGDGSFEMLAPSLWGADWLLLDARGERLDSLRIPFHACQC
ncbi:hypothetical protein Hoch_4439 [Haliangium ochraceum DSM 14365]|uniref:Uncharacterized protein n=2 Tax=Haliangium ochraceum TaxID=80816 RepID=D0LNM8_HALO1|nr:hypothetical protein Hoch_4439 [Haliangium ochraceum DSM 14365]